MAAPCGERASAAFIVCARCTCFASTGWGRGGVHQRATSAFLTLFPCPGSLLLKAEISCRINRARAGGTPGATEYSQEISAWCFLVWAMVGVSGGTRECWVSSHGTRFVAYATAKIRAVGRESIDFPPMRSCPPPVVCGRPCSGRKEIASPRICCR